MATRNSQGGSETVRIEWAAKRPDISSFCLTVSL
jgi:hypothetical protein